MEDSFLLCLPLSHGHSVCRGGFHESSPDQGVNFGSGHPPFFPVLDCPIVVIGEVSRSEIDSPKLTCFTNP
ncbi:hypothetical protein HOLleu_41343 [Holothuria leucospilota]|uniref:Uncharacterized protein n=1 Tax=Holothuria leucospilota TaxID=206669 RepID=A0A9Q1BC16_HOLLE|nr:hypothetical protein HOLleu_41343 [Holothuria leucospilota]